MAASKGGGVGWGGVVSSHGRLCCAGAAVVSLAGRENGKPKAANQDSFLTHTVQPCSPASIIGMFMG